MTVQPVLIAGEWRASDARGSFAAENPATRDPLPARFPLSSYRDCDDALDAAVDAARIMRTMPAEQFAAFLESYAGRIEARRDDLVETAHLETALPKSPRLADVELPRTSGQLRQAAAACRDRSWKSATIDNAAGIRSYLAPLGPVSVFGPNNFPFAFNSIAGGDFAAAVAAGNPVIAKANSSHPDTTRIFAEEAHQAAVENELPPGTVQLLYRLDHADGEWLVSDSRLAATAYTGSRAGGLKLKAAADKAGKLIYLELSSINPVVILPAALRERGEEIADEFTTSCLMGAGQFCTNPGFVLLLAGEETGKFVDQLAGRFESAPAGTLLSAGVQASLQQGLATLQAAGAEVLAGGAPGAGQGHCCANTLLRVSAQRFLAEPATLQTEAFGNCSLLVVAETAEEAAKAIEQLEGNLTGCIYSDSAGEDEPLYAQLAERLRPRVGRLLNDKMPTGVAVSPAMNHGGPYPATGHPGFTAVGIPAALRRFAALECFDNVRPHRLPAELQDKNPTGHMWRQIDGKWTQGDVA